MYLIMVDNTSTPSTTINETIISNEIENAVKRKPMN